jgi:pimeloyl-ACP methyl ester carboxylesterase
MSVMNLDGVPIAYQCFGQGPPIVVTPGGFFGRQHQFCHFMAGNLSTDHTVVIWDRRNGHGASGVAISDALSDFHQWTDDLHQLLGALDLSPAYLLGGSGGHVFSLLMAHRYPEDVKGLLLVQTPTDDLGILGRLADVYRFSFAEIAVSQGMEQVISSSVEAWQRTVSGQAKPDGLDRARLWIAETIHSNPDNRDRIIALEPEEFATAMRRWGNWMVSERVWSSGLADDDLRTIVKPTIVTPGWDEAHPTEIAQHICSTLPMAEWVDLTDIVPKRRMEAIKTDFTYTEFSSVFCPLIRKFITRAEDG